jgi:type VI protein secretion system component VasK
VMVVVFMVFACMNIYIYPIMVTFELSLKQLYRNAFIFAVIKFLPNLLILLINALIVLLSFGLIIPFHQIFGFFIYILLTMSLTGLITNFYAYRRIKKYMISRLEDEEEEEEEDEDEGEDETEENDEISEAAADEDDSSGGNDSGNDDGIKRYY